MYLIDYLIKERYNATEFAKKIGISSKTIYNILKGHDTKNSIAMKIYDETKGRVTNRELCKPPEKNIGQDQKDEVT